MKLLLHAVLAFCILMMFSLQTGAQIWISNSAPKESSSKVALTGMHKLSTLRGKRGSTKVIQWLRSGSSVEESLFSQADSSAVLLLFDPQKQKIAVETIADHNSSAFVFNNTDEGFYNLFYLTEKVHNDNLQIACASREILNHSCRNGHAKELKYIPYKTFADDIPMQIVRERTKADDLHYFVTSGESVTFRVLIDGKPAEDVKMTFVTQKGWKKVLFTDDAGIASFEIIQDYFTNWNVFDVKKIHNYLLIAEKTFAETGIHQQNAFTHIKYVTTYSEAYLPAKTNYMSFVWGLIVFFITVIASSIAVYVYRNRRNVLKKHNYELPSKY